MGPQPVHPTVTNPCSETPFQLSLEDCYCSRMSRSNSGSRTSRAPPCRPAVEWGVSHDPGRVMQLFPWLGSRAASLVPSWVFTAVISSVALRVFAAWDPSPPWRLRSVLLWLRGPAFQLLDVHLPFCHPVGAIFPVAMVLGPGLTGLPAFWKQGVPKTGNGYRWDELDEQISQELPGGGAWVLLSQASCWRVSP